MKQVTTPEITYYAIGCPACDDMFREFFVFCIQNIIPYKVERHVKDLDEPLMKWGEEWFTGDDMVNKFKDQWRVHHAV